MLQRRGSMPARRVVSGQSQKQARTLNTNAKGGVFVDPKEVKDAFKFYDKDGRDVITRADIEDYIDIIFPDMPVKDIKKLIGSAGMSLERLEQLLLENEVDDFDPVGEVFKLFDPDEQGYVDMDVLKVMFERLPGVGKMTDDDVKVLLHMADTDGDGRISLEDFAGIGRYDDGTRARSPGRRGEGSGGFDSMADLAAAAAAGGGDGGEGGEGEGAEGGGEDGGEEAEGGHGEGAPATDAPAAEGAGGGEEAPPPGPE